MSITFGKTKTSKGITAGSAKATSPAGIASAKKRNQTVSREGGKVVIRQKPGTFGGTFSEDRQPGKIVATSEGQKVVKDSSSDVQKFFKAEKSESKGQDFLTQLPVGLFPAGSAPAQAFQADTRNTILTSAIQDIQKGAPITDHQISAVALGTNTSFAEAKSILRNTFPDRAFASGDNVVVDTTAFENTFSDSRVKEFTSNIPESQQPPPATFEPPTQPDFIAGGILAQEQLPETSIKEALFDEGMLQIFNPIQKDGSVNWLAIIIYAVVILFLLGVLL